jgi:hypothetical protein
MQSSSASRLSDRDLVDQVTRLAAAEKGATVTLIGLLAEVYARRLHERAGYATLFIFCTDALRLSESEAYDRMKAAKIASRFPAALTLLGEGRLTLTTIRLLAPHLTATNHQELFAEASGLGKRQVQELIARLFPEEDVPSSITQLVPPPEGFTVLPPPLIRPLSPDRYQITFTVSGDTRAKLELAQDLLRHAIPNGDPARIFARAIEVLVEELVRLKYAANAPGVSHGHDGESRYIPVEVKRAVFIRDGGRCAFVGAGGRRCGERSFVEFHHVIPWAAGGRSTVDNIQLRCRAHNEYESEMYYGPLRSDPGSAEARAVAAEVERAAANAERVMDDTLSFWNEKEVTRAKG